MTKDEMIEGLKAGRTLAQDGWATEEEKRAVRELWADGLITIVLEQVGEQYSRYRIRWADMQKA